MLNTSWRLPKTKKKTITTFLDLTIVPHISASAEENFLLCRGKSFSVQRKNRAQNESIWLHPQHSPSKLGFAIGLHKISFGLPLVHQPEWPDQSRSPRAIRRCPCNGPQPPLYRHLLWRRTGRARQCCRHANLCPAPSPTPPAQKNWSSGIQPQRSVGTEISPMSTKPAPALMPRASMQIAVSYQRKMIASTLQRHENELFIEKTKGHGLGLITTPTFS